MASFNLHEHSHLIYLITSTWELLVEQFILRIAHMEQCSLNCNYNFFCFLQDANATLSLRIGVHYEPRDLQPSRAYHFAGVSCLVPTPCPKKTCDYIFFNIFSLTIIVRLQ